MGAGSSVLRVVAGVIARQGKVWVGRRSPGRDGAGFWEFPGGKVEAGETDAQALRRELNEELGVDVAVGQRLGDVTAPHGAGTLHLVFYACDLVAGEPRLRDHDAMRWCGPDELATVQWQDADRPAAAGVAAWLMGQEMGG